MKKGVATMKKIAFAFGLVLAVIAGSAAAADQDMTALRKALQSLPVEFERQVYQLDELNQAAKALSVEPTDKARLQSFLSQLCPFILPGAVSAYNGESGVTDLGPEQSYLCAANGFASIASISGSSSAKGVRVKVDLFSQWGK